MSGNSDISRRSAVRRAANEIMQKWDDWDGEAGQAAQVEQNPEAGEVVMRSRIVEVLQRLLTKTRDFRPHVHIRPRVFLAGGKEWLAMYGSYADGVVGRGDSPQAACEDFDRKWATPIGRESE